LEWTLESTADDIVRIVQLTDTHLGETPHSELLGLDTDESLEHVVDLAVKEWPNADVVLVTGDLSDKGSQAATTRVHQYLKAFKKPMFWLPGNHDMEAEMASASDSLVKQLVVGKWRIILLNSAVQGMVGGHLSDSELLFLNNALASAEEEHILLAMHHHPIACGTAWLDEQVINNADELFEMTAQYPAVKGIIWGHIHQEYVGTYQGMLMLGSPSTCVQFYPGSDGFRADTRAPGYRWLKLHPNGHIETAVSRVTTQSFRIDFDAKGY
jgi:Icc protein